MSRRRDSSIYDRDLDRVEANYRPLTPISFLERSAAVYPEKTAVIHGDLRFTYAELYERCRKLASALARRGIGPGDTVSVMASNVPAMLEAHFGVPMAGAVLNALNYRLDPGSIAYILEHGQSKLLITDREYSDTVADAIGRMDNPPAVIDIDDPLFEGGRLLGEKDYEALLEEGASADPYRTPSDEWQAISLCYSSGTTGQPKGIVYHHRGAYLNAIGQILAFGIDEQSVYLWTLPMFHCNGWTYTWGVTAAAGTHVCLRQVDPAVIFPMIKQHAVTHMCGAPVVLNMLIHAPQEQRVRFDHTVEVATGGAAPPSRVISAMEELGFRVLHLYGLTETYGPATLCAWQGEWGTLDTEARAAKMARQGVVYHTLQELMVADSETMEPVPWDGVTMGELMLCGNTVMRGYLKNADATEEAFRGGWFHTGDLAVRHPDGYVEVKDRAKDVIISGGENVSSLEVEELLYKHPSIMEAAVVARPDDFWGETVCAFVTLKPETESVSDEQIMTWCRDKIARYKIPKTIVFGPLPKTSTGKIQKFVLRDQAKAL
ncbi:MAG: AMP-binding protein [Gammaproteobacteria bacterium]|nr:AMP-binding protein [Gammaproteobacteria bacterium]NIM74516.1 AMP-binding protein [Gammaproteobacteria bacterium]NIO26349.1 AMP-binding protein [Gammaproteobacteria bacterium]NIO66901.1 AMP-binding protein [Gammaproteobacteria bacterium]NIP45211.1 acyl-CoA synthetase [Gammaproteobacteria bacterium]